jgi:G3E family GTPase
MDNVDRRTDKTPVHVIAGFLGVGKTTVLLDLLTRLSPKEKGAVLVNEWGEVSLDSSVIESQGSSVEIADVSGGCICCTAGAAFDKALDMIMNEVEPDRIFIEPSGVAKPGDIIDLARSHDQAERFALRPVIGLVDPARFLLPNIMRMPLYRNQVESSQILVANRCDTVDQETISAFLEKANRLYPPKAAVFTTSHGKLPLEVLDIETASDSGAPRSLPRRHTPEGEESTDHEFAQNGWVWPHVTCFSDTLLREFFEQLSTDPEASEPKLERVKGIFHTDRGWFLMDIAGGDFNRRDIQHRSDSRCQFIASEGTAGELEIFKTRLDGCIIHEP